MAQESALLMPYFRIAAMRDESELLRADAALAVYRERERARALLRADALLAVCARAHTHTERASENRRFASGMWTHTH